MPKDTAARPTARAPRSKRIRPYALTGGRTRARHHLLVETLISVPRYDPTLSQTLMPESKALYERARTQLSPSPSCPRCWPFLSASSGY